MLRTGGSGDDGENETRFAERGEFDPDDTARAVLLHRIGHRERDARLAHARRTGDSDEPDAGVAQHSGQNGQLTLPPDEFAPGHAEMVPPQRTGCSNCLAGRISIWSVS